MKTGQQLTAWMDCKVTRPPMFAVTIIVWIRLTNPRAERALDSQALEKSAALGVGGQTSADRKSGGGNTRVV